MKNTLLPVLAIAAMSGGLAGCGGGLARSTPAVGPRAEPTKVVDLRPLWDIERVLHNPYKGWYHHYYDNGTRNYALTSDDDLDQFPGMDHLYIRLSWAHFEPQEGRCNWSWQVKEFTGITASPLIEGRFLLLYICGKPAACVVAFDMDSGKEAWRALDDSSTYSSPIVISDGGRRQVIVWTQEEVTSLDPSTGKIWWREQLHTPGDQAISTPVYANHRLLVAGLMLKLDADAPIASVLWPESNDVSKRILSNTSTALLQGGYAYSAKSTGELVCLEAATGHQVWSTNTVTSLKNGSSRPSYSQRRFGPALHRPGKSNLRPAKFRGLSGTRSCSSDRCYLSV